MKRTRISLYSALSILLLLMGCSQQKMEDLLRPLVKAPGATIERNVKGHDQIYAVTAILRLTLPSSRKGPDGKNYYISYGISDIRKPPIPIYQQIDISKDADGQMRITSARKHFDVIKYTGKDEFYTYSLELKYYDLNGKMINYQFGSYDKDDEDGSNLIHHQHFFTFQNYSLIGEMMYYPTHLDGTFYDEYTFQRDASGKRIPANMVSANNVYVPIDDADDAPVKYDKELGRLAADNATTKKAVDVIEYQGKSYRLYKTINTKVMTEKTKDLFTYKYRDTDPIDGYLHDTVGGIDDMGRDRSIKNRNTIRLQQERSLETREAYDYLGFKGILTFKKADINFRMRICIAHILWTNKNRVPDKYVVKGRPPRAHNEISSAWNSYDIDYPLEFRVIADLDGDQAKFVQDVKKAYPDADEEQLLKMFGKDLDWFAHIPRVTM
ncbi:hypothetical protein [Porphyromonas somerae]|uniref:hypothetical protein n=1 Tax=Porphyromonas somerae TaxID=322095 RepID=UPI002A75C4A7|nr:hypothetical protein [Porphyromonas somerae]MDY3119909.1 hypothetical protein [Porphyromonas somerae]